MSLFTIADLHLSFGVDKPMQIFKGWNHYVEKIEKNWNETIGPEDTVVLPGDLSWGMTLEESQPDFAFIHRLPGRKILLKGNHDYWFSTKAKTEAFFCRNGFDSLYLLFNNSFEYGEFSLCGTRGWMNESGEPNNPKVLSREVGRMRLSLSSAAKQPIVFLHYPPLSPDSCWQEMIDLLHEYQVKRVFYGHIHGKACRYAVQGERDGIEYRLVSGDHLQFHPVKIL